MKEKLIELAFRFRGQKLWLVLADNDIFAVKLSDGQIAYCSVMGNGGQHYGLGVYIGNGWNTYLNYAGMNDAPSELEMRHMMCTRLDCINCDFSPAYMVEESEQKQETMNYAKEHVIADMPGVGIPDFVRYEPYACPGPIREEKDEDVMEEVLTAVIWLGGQVMKQSYISLGFTWQGIRPSDIGGQEVPMVVRSGRGWRISATTLPPRAPEKHPVVEYSHPDIAMQIAMLPVRSNLECRFLAVDTPVTPKGEKGYFPVLLMFVDGNTGYVNITKAEQFNPAATPLRLVEEFALKILASGSRPFVVYVMEDDTQAMLKDFCTKTGIKMQRVNRLKHLQEAWDSLSNAMRSGQ